MRHAFFTVTCLMFVIVVSCSGSHTGNNDQVIAEVAGQKLTLEEVRRYVPVYIYEQDSVSAIRDYRRNWVNRQVLLQEAKRVGIDKNIEVREKIRRAEEDILAASLLDLVQREVKEQGVSRQEAQTYYENNRDQFVLTERHVRYRHMVTETMRDSENAKNALMRGVEWEEVARRYSVDPETAIQNSRMFWPISKAAIDYGAMNQYLNLIGMTEISPVSVVNGRVHFVQLREDKNAGEHPDLEWVIDHISEWLLVEKQRRLIRTYERNLFLKAESNNEIKLYDVHNIDKAKEIPIIQESDTLTSN